MGETRNPALGGWVVFEGNDPVTDLERALPWRSNVNRPIQWPVTLRVHRIRDGLSELVDVEVTEDLKVSQHHQRMYLHEERLP